MSRWLKRYALARFAALGTELALHEEKGAPGLYRLRLLGVQGEARLWVIDEWINVNDVMAVAGSTFGLLRIFEPVFDRLELRWHQAGFYSRLTAAL